MQAPVEAALGEGFDVAVAGQEVECFLLIAGEELGSHGGDKGDGHDLGGAELRLAIIFVSECFEQFIEEAVEGYNLFGHGRLLAEGLRQPHSTESLHGLHQVATWVNNNVTSK